MLQPTGRRLRFALGVRGVLGAAAPAGEPSREDMLCDVGTNYGTKKVKGRRAWRAKESAMQEKCENANVVVK
jgi:hypothetical protein